MIRIYIILLIISVGFVSCDGRQNKRESLQKSITEFNTKYTQSQSITFFPKEYTEIVTDSIVSNRVKVSIKNYSSMDETIILASSEKNTNYHRVFESEIVISFSSKAVFSTYISAKEFKLNNINDKFWNNATLEHVWVNQELSTEQTIQLDMSFINPKDKSFKLYRMSIDEKGQKLINLIEQQG